MATETMSATHPVGGGSNSFNIFLNLEKINKNRKIPKIFIIYF